MSDIDDIIQPDNLDDKGNIDSKPRGTKIGKNNNNTLNKLDSLRFLLQEDDVKFNANDHLPQPGDFPVSQNIKLVDYNAEDIICLEEATGVIDSIILNYIKSDSLLNSDKVMKIKNNHIKTLAELDGLVKSCKTYKIMIQEGIDAGDMSPEMFKMHKEYSMDMRAGIDARSKHIEKCEIYWKNYALMYGLENKEEEIIRKTESKEDEGPKKTITDITSLNELIEKKMKAQAEKMEIDKEKRDNDIKDKLGEENNINPQDDVLLNDAPKKKKKKEKKKKDD